MVIGAHSSMAEQPAHNRLGLGSSPGGPTTVTERLHGLKRGGAEIESGGAVVLERSHALRRRWAEIESGGVVVLERLHGLKRGWAEIESSGSARRVDRLLHRSRLHRAGPRSSSRSSHGSWSRGFSGSCLRQSSGHGSVGRVNGAGTNDIMESTWIHNCKH